MCVMCYKGGFFHIFSLLIFQSSHLSFSLSLSFSLVHEKFFCSSHIFPILLTIIFDILKELFPSSPLSFLMSTEINFTLQQQFKNEMWVAFHAILIDIAHFWMSRAKLIFMKFAAPDSK